MRRNLKCCALLLIALWGALYLNIVSAEQAVWIDADPACGHAKTDDVDDCWALLLALHSNELEILGISTLFGNGSGEKSYSTATEVIRRFGTAVVAQNIHRGADRPLDLNDPKMNEASRALAKALANEPLTIIALGPLTNIATLILNHPELLSNINRVIAVAGQRPDIRLGFYPGRSRLFHLHDLNFRKDVAAFEILLHSGMSVTLVPYEIASKITILPDDLAQLNSGDPQSQWLSEISEPWMDFWRTSLQTDGFYPFDSLAIGILTMPDLYTCESIPAKIQHKRALFVTSRDKLLVSHDFNNERLVSYCYDINQIFKSKLIERVQ